MPKWDFRQQRASRRQGRYLDGAVVAHVEAVAGRAVMKERLCVDERSRIASEVRVMFPQAEVADDGFELAVR